MDGEGGSTRPATAKAAVNYVMCCVKFQKAGMHVQGNKWVTFNDLTQRYEFLYLKKGFRASYEQ